MTPRDAVLALSVLKDPTRRRRLVRRAGINAARLKLSGPFDYRVDGTTVVASVDGVEVARLDAFEGAERC